MSKREINTTFILLLLKEILEHLTDIYKEEKGCNEGSLTDKEFAIIVANISFIIKEISDYEKKL